MLIHHNPLITGKPHRAFTEDDLLFLRRILFKKLTEVQNIDEKNRLLCQKRDAMIDYWLVTDALKLDEMDLSGADLSGVDLSYFGNGEVSWPDTPELFPFPLQGVKVCLANASLAGANLTMVGMGGADLTGTDLSHTNLTYADFSDANLTRAILRGARATKAVLLWGTCLQDAILDEAELVFDMCKADLKGTSIKRGKLRGRCWSGNLTYACLSMADLCEMDFSRSALDHADLSGANLTGCCLNNVSMDGLCLRGANLTGCWGTTDGVHPNDISGYHHENVILDGAYQEIRVTDATETVLKKPVTLNEFIRMNMCKPRSPDHAWRDNR
ncbi:MAG TPA: pentapeptide repeat-containing protein [Puia sp.]|jgi:uncharacterized protein YjbI with pentapeptide repeats|nr:pentapeptide repeat-containing protein [Puia sp.]